MNLQLKRFRYTSDKTFGKLYIDGKFFCYTLEDTLRPWGIKVRGITGIPAGEYNIKMSESWRFKRVLPMIYSEDNGYELKNAGVSFKGIRIHRGNYPRDTEGCILVGLTINDWGVGDSTKAEKRLVHRLKDIDVETITIINLRPDND